MREHGIVRRFSRLVKGVDSAILSALSQEETASFVPLGEFGGVNVTILDLSSRNPTWTFKDLVACVTISYCKQESIDVFVAQSSGNTANALGYYAGRAGVSVVLFYPAQSRYKLDANLLGSRGVFSVEVEGPEPVVKSLSKRFSECVNLPLLPTYGHQIEGNKLRAYLIADYEREHRVHHNWHIQALSSGYGVFGYYAGVEELISRGYVVSTPQLFGVQQEAVCPYATHIPQSASLRMIEPTLFRTKPSEHLLKTMSGITSRYGGVVVAVSNQAFLHHFEQAMAMFKQGGIQLMHTELNGCRMMVEQAGVIAATGFFEGLAQGRFSPGDSVLIVFTGGARPRPPQPVTPDHIIRMHDLDPIGDLVKRMGRINRDRLRRLRGLVRP